MAKMLRPYPVEYVCPNMGQVALLVRAYADNNLNGDASPYWYSQKAEEWSLGLVEAGGRY